jgi:hypothetical protein
LVGAHWDWINAYYFSSSDREAWQGWGSPNNYVPLFNKLTRTINTTLKRGDVLILIMYSARGSFHVAQALNVYTKNRVGTWNSFGTFSTGSVGASAFWIRIPQNATDDQLLNEYTYITRADVVAGVAMGSSTIVQAVTDGNIYVLRGVPTSRNPTLNTSVSASWANADNNEIAQRVAFQDFGKYNTLYLNYVYTPIDLNAGDKYPDDVGGIYSNDLFGGFDNNSSINVFLRNISSDNSLWETFNVSWISDNIPRMYSTSPVYNNRLQRHNFFNRTYPAITGFFDSTAGILIEIPY